MMASLVRSQHASRFMVSSFGQAVLHVRASASATAVSSPSTPGEKKFRYTRDNSVLSGDQRQFYEDNGFIILKNMIERDMLNRLTKRFNEIASGQVNVPGLVVMKEVTHKGNDGQINANIVYKLQDLFADEQLFSYCCHPGLLDYVDAFVGHNQMAMNTMLINKPPDSGFKTSRHPLHQDAYYFPFGPSERVVCAWTAMERVTRENGCLFGVPGSHKGRLEEHSYPEWDNHANKAFHGIHGYEKALAKGIHWEMDAGDTVFFHPLIIHGSGVNRTKGFRKSIACHYAASECTYYDVKDTIQEAVGQEILEIYRRRGLNLTDYRDAWRVRARLVRGKQLTM